MLHYSVVFLVIALLAAVFGLGNLAVAAAGIAGSMLVVFICHAVASQLVGRLRRQ
ncbi:MAG: DUF1328 domain-containing protein [Rubrivivax sp.]|nr:DUF1328 domain-containing protein [Rubrivivax sp.]